MKKMKKLAALVLAGAMVMGMSTTAMADGLDAQIAIKNADETAKFNCVKIVQADTTTLTGWDIVDEYVDEFTAEGAFKGLTEQEILAGMIYAQNASADKGVEIPGFAGKYAVALNKIHGQIATGNLTTPITVTEAGVFFIKGTDSENYTYSPMAAYIAFDEYDTTTGVPTDLKDTTVEAKRIPLKVEKDAIIDGSDEITEIGRLETYKVTSTVPYLPTTDSTLDRQYWAKDTITGAEYVVEKEGANAGKVAVTVKVGETTTTQYATLNADGKGFALDLSYLIDATNSNANKAIELRYQAVVKDIVVRNDVKMGDGDTDGRFGSSYEDLFTGKIVLTKYASDDTPNDLTNNAILANAKFKVYKEVAGEKVWATFGADGKFTGWEEAEYAVDASDEVKAEARAAAEAAATVVVTGADGKLTVQGLDSGTYWFKEVEAPNGYSINTTDVNATLKLANGVTVATAVLEADTHMIDTELSALPSTGGIGTTIFTIGGVAIILAAAAMLFARKRVAR